MEQLPADFDWVKARGDCSLAVEFIQLRSDAQRNVESRNNLSDINNQFRFVLYPANDGFCVVRRSREDTVVVFLLKGDHVSVEDKDGKQMFKVTIGLNKDGDCRFEMNREQMERWQVLRLTLEPLFFKGI